MRRQIFIPLAMALVSLLPMTGCVSVDERRQRTVERAEALLDMGDTAKALDVLNGFLSFDPRDQQMRRHMARIHLDADRPGAAISILEALPGDVDWQDDTSRLWIESLIADGRYRRAATVLQRAEARGESDLESRRRLLAALATTAKAQELSLPEPWLEELAALQIDADRLAEAAWTLERLPASPPRAELAEHLFEAGLEHRNPDLFRELAAAGPEPASSWTLLMRHRLLMEDGLEDEAARLEQDFLQRFGDHPRRFQMLLVAGRRHLRGTDAERALNLAREASALRPGSTEALVDQAFALRALDRREEAVHALETALALRPDSRPARALLERLDNRSDGVQLRLSIDGRVVQ